MVESWIEEEKRKAKEYNAQLKRGVPIFPNLSGNKARAQQVHDAWEPVKKDEGWNPPDPYDERDSERMN